MLENRMVIDGLWREQEERAERVAKAEISEEKLTQLNDIENKLIDIRNRLQEIGQEFNRATEIQLAAENIERAEEFISLYVKHIEQGRILLDY